MQHIDSDTIFFTVYFTRYFCNVEYTGAEYYNQDAEYITNEISLLIIFRIILPKTHTIYIKRPQQNTSY